MYRELREAWKRELENVELEKLPTGFYSGIADYVRRLKEESRMLDKRTAKANLLKKELQNVKRMTRELIQSRHRKILNDGARGNEVQHDLLTPEEEAAYARISVFADMVSSLTAEILHGQAPKIDVTQEHKRDVLRFTKDVPAIVGADMKTYGPFKPEDVASLPVENAKMLVKQCLAHKITVG
jgi:DNA replication factor GINS